MYRLQEGVPDTIYSLQQAGISVWMLTGDQLDTAISIGKSCNLLIPQMKHTTIQLSKRRLFQVYEKAGIGVGSRDDILLYQELYKNKSSAAKSKAFRILEGFVEEALQMMFAKVGKHPTFQDSLASQEMLLEQERAWALIIEGDLIDPCLSPLLEDKFFKIC